MTDAHDLLAYLGAAPSPFHAVAETAERLASAGFSALDLDEPWEQGPGRHYVARGGALVAWEVPDGAGAARRFRIVGAHTDSPNLRIKPRPDTGGFGWQQLGVEVYGGALWNSWLDRDLGLSGRVIVRTPEGLEERLFLVDRPLLRIPQLAIHLDRDVNGQGLKLNPQQHLTPVWGAGPVEVGAFAAHLAQEVGVEAADVVAWDAMVHDTTPGALLGRHQELVSSARLDNLVSCWAALTALTALTAPAAAEGANRPIGVVCLFDHEEVGSTSATGADGALLAQVLERSVLARGGDRADLLRAFAGSICASADMAHATHPNYPERHEPGHLVTIDGGPVIKVNANQRYATEASTHAVLIEACEQAEVPHQVFVGRNDQPCGSTIGPLTAARLGIATADLGVAQLSMHSARELCGADDPARLAAALGVFLRT
ncbi:M18 family aminopeptidase [Aquihabitans sp. McL0605]|uniref:M18 family aminopeptidase n=1 Tax=Aquihabitans sp. McL0605 TaxID=3415671 RepID=UPI003CFB0A1E